MSTLLTAAVTVIGIPLCAIAVIGGIWQYPYLIVLPIGAYYLMRAAYRRASASSSATSRRLSKQGWSWTPDTSRRQANA